MKFQNLCFLVGLVFSSATLAQSQPPYGTDAWAIEQGDAARGESLFGQRCMAGHRAESLAEELFPLEGVGSNKLCLFLQTHGATDQARDCDLIA